MSQHAASLERQLRQDPAAKASAVSTVMKESTAPLWLDLRARWFAIRTRRDPLPAPFLRG